ncbi:MAG: hypothetical protein KGL39_04370 [Patescibacteria group bacterium]|nr:hypothetical protein [Patescibacteria group bacterium]
MNYLGTVYPSRPTILQEEDYVQEMNGTAVAASANGSACVAVVNLYSDERTRITDTGRGFVNDFDKHLVDLELFFACTSGDALAAMDDYDSIVDALVVGIRANPVPGPTGVIWSIGEFDYGVRHEADEPYSPDAGLTILINGKISFEAWEQLAGTNV